jgi:hypothetical protein
MMDRINNNLKAVIMNQRAMMKKRMKKKRKLVSLQVLRAKKMK